MRLIFNKIFLEHDTGFHPENKDRLKLFLDTPETQIENGEKFLRLAHTEEYINRVKAVCEKGEMLDYDTPTSPRSYEVACYAVGAVILACENKGFALVRPPGHHASASRGAGFCLFNNMAIAAKYLAEKGKRVFIVDFDLHHGNGTEDIVFGDERILYFSTHQSPFYPGTGLASRGNCINVPLSYGTSDEEYMKILETEMVPAINAFKPDVIGLSAGFDAYIKDFNFLNPAGGFQLTLKSYQMIRDIINPYPHFAVLEGGYNPESIKEGVDVFTIPE